MALIKCSNCNRDISDKAEKCIHCGTPIHKEEPKVEKIAYTPSAEPKVGKAPSKEARLKIKPAVRIIINILANIGLFVLVFFAGTIITNYSGNYSVIGIIDYIFNNKPDFCIFIKTFLFIYILIFTVLCSFKSRITNILSLIGYIFFLLFEAVFCLYITRSRWDVNIIYYILLIYTAAWLAYLIWTIPKKKKRVVEVVEEPVIKEKPDMYKELVKLKELLDMKAITEEEYNDMKKELLEKQKEHWN